GLGCFGGTDRSTPFAAALADAPQRPRRPAAERSSAELLGDAHRSVQVALCVFETLELFQVPAACEERVRELPARAELLEDGRRIVEQTERRFECTGCVAAPAQLHHCHRGAELVAHLPRDRKPGA